MRIAIILCALLCAAGILAQAEIQQDVINRDPAAGAAGSGDTIDFNDTDGKFEADKIGPAIEELDDPNEAGPNAPDGKVNWEQLVDVPEGFADGVDNVGSGGGDMTVREEDGSPSVSGVESIEFDQDSGFTVTDEGAGVVGIGLSLADENASGPNAGDGLVNWEQVMNMPEPFVDGQIDADEIPYSDAGYPGVTNVEGALGALVNEPGDGPNSEDSVIPWENLKNVPSFGGTLFQLAPQGYSPPLSNFATIGSRGALPVLVFAGDVCAIWGFALDSTYAGNGVTVEFLYTANQTSNDTDWDGSWARIDGQDIDSIAFSTAVSSDDNSNPGTSGAPARVTISFDHGDEMNGCGAGDFCLFRLCRDFSGDTSNEGIQFLRGYGYETP